MASVVLPWGRVSRTDRKCSLELDPVSVVRLTCMYLSTQGCHHTCGTSARFIPVQSHRMLSCTRVNNLSGYSADHNTSRHHPRQSSQVDRRQKCEVTSNSLTPWSRYFDGSRPPPISRLENGLIFIQSLISHKREAGGNVEGVEHEEGDEDRHATRCLL